MNKYADATLDELLAVVAAADALYRCECEFEPSIHLGACSEYRDALDQALIRCPGTTAHGFSKVVPVAP